MRVVRLFIRGRVQGVGYRAWTVDTAARFGLDGWVRNRVDGTVEAVAAGDDAAVERFIEACRSGPRLAHVTGVELATADRADAGSGGFQPRPTV
ncbi:MAG TPA: acylphosphatase [Candidatus Sulfotelmatobacter sp.]|nr:acylphosphatase [Candidatus Sulfotelmatobacter sp.]